MASFGSAPRSHLERRIYAQDPLAGVTLRVGTWGGSWREARHELIGQKLEEMRRGRVKYVIGTPRDNFAKLLTAPASGETPQSMSWKYLARADAHAGEAGLSGGAKLSGTSECGRSRSGLPNAVGGGNPSDPDRHRLQQEQVQ